MNVKVGCLEREFAESLNNLYIAYRRIWKELPWGGKCIVQRTIPDDCNLDSNDAVSLFSFGVDSIATFVRHENIKTLVTIVGADISNNDQGGIMELQKQSQVVASKYCVNYCCIQSNFKEMINYSSLKKLIPEGTDWWTNFQHGPVLVGFLLLVAHIYRCNKAFIASTHNINYLTRIGSRPDLETVIKYDRLSVFHDGAELTRQQKLAIVKQNWDERLHVCWKREGFVNCCECEKCVRTILGYLVLGNLEAVHKYFSRLQSYDQLRHSIARIFSSENKFDWGDAGYYEDIKNHLKNDDYYRNECGFDEELMKIINMVREFDPYDKFFSDLMDGYEKQRKRFLFERSPLRYCASL